MDKNLEKIWSTALGELEVVISKANFQTWFKSTFIFEFKNGIFTIGVPSFFIEDYLKKHYKNEIKSALQKQVDEPIDDIKFKVASKDSTTDKPAKVPVVIHRAVDNSEDFTPVENTVENPKNQTLRPRHTFETFIVGTSNQLAHAAAKSVADKPGKSYNPLYIYGDSGLGKTHLIQAVGNGVISKKPKAKVMYVSCESFTNDYIDSVRVGKAKEFKDRYRNVDLLIVDDIQFLGKMDKTQEEFFHTFNHLHEKDKQVVLASDRPPKDIKGLEKRLITRFEWGMVADIQTPDFETRCAILRAKAEERGLDVSEEVINFIAENIQSSIRELEGALTKLFAFCELSGEQPSLSTAERVLGEVINRGQKRQAVSTDRVLKAVAKFYHVDIEDIVSK